MDPSSIAVLQGYLSGLYTEVIDSIRSIVVSILLELIRLCFVRVILVLYVCVVVVVVVVMIEGLLDRHFEQLQILQETFPQFIDEVLSLYIKETQRIINIANTYLESSPVDYHNLVGARLVKLACIDLRRASETENYAGCLEAFTNVRNECDTIQVKFETILELARNPSPPPSMAVPPAGAAGPSRAVPPRRSGGSV
ncbi:hypothetical protein Sjap_012349 [Stephania japonica]|uniref:Histidine-containing phosphotransfer protein n=1 Tax=Stephania japonica TaxID=461633 RepID=A0AAP0IXS6_9MAGN